jgi:hypothetical protein
MQGGHQDKRHQDRTRVAGRWVQAQTPAAKPSLHHTNHTCGLGDRQLHSSSTAVQYNSAVQLTAVSRPAQLYSRAVQQESPSIPAHLESSLIGNSSWCWCLCRLLVAAHSLLFGTLACATGCCCRRRTAAAVAGSVGGRAAVPCCSAAVHGASCCCSCRGVACRRGAGTHHHAFSRQEGEAKWQVGFSHSQ